jgi:hypothetical protein
MKTFTLTSFAVLFAAFANSAPAPAAQYGPFQAQITFEGAAGAVYTLEVPTDGSVFYICMFLSSQTFPSPF